MIQDGDLVLVSKDGESWLPGVLIKLWYLRKRGWYLPQPVARVQLEFVEWRGMWDVGSFTGFFRKLTHMGHGNFMLCDQARDWHPPLKHAPVYFSLSMVTCPQCRANFIAMRDKFREKIR